MILADWMQKVDLETEIHEVYIHSFLFRFATSLISIFIPLYILDIGFAPIYAITFYIVYDLTMLVFSVPFAYLAARIGYKRVALLSSILWLSFYLFLRVVETYPALYLAAVIGGMGFNLYWIGMNPEVAESSHEDRTDKESGFFFSMPSLANIVSPFVGGLILALLGFSSLFVLATVMIGVSFVPFLFSREHRGGMELGYSDFVSKEYLDDFLTYFFDGLQSVGHIVIWPLYIAVVIGGSVNIGSVGSLLALGGALSSIFVGKLSQRYGRNKVLFYGPSCLALVVVSMALTGSVAVAFLVSLLHGLFHNTLTVPIYGSAIDRSEESDVLEYFTFREVALTLGRLFGLSIAGLGFVIVPEYKFLAAFSFMAVAVLLCSFFARRI